MREVRSVNLGLKPDLNRPVRPGGGIRPGATVSLLGTVFDQGVYQHRVDQINQFYNPDARSIWKVPASASDSSPIASVTPRPT